MSKNANKNQPYQSSSSIPGADDLQGRYEKALNDLRRARGEAHFWDWDNAQDRATLEKAGFRIGPALGAAQTENGLSAPAPQGVFRLLVSQLKI